MIYENTVKMKSYLKQIRTNFKITVKKQNLKWSLDKVFFPPTIFQNLKRYIFPYFQKSVYQYLSLITHYFQD